MSPSEFILGTGVAAFCCGPDCTISLWNRAAERMFARRTRDVVGRECFGVLTGRDVFGNDFCSQLCPCRRMACSGKLIHPFHMEVQDALEHRFIARIAILVVQEDGGLELIHLLEPIVSGDSAATDCEDHDPLRKRSKIGPEFLTHREVEVLRFLTLGLGTCEISERLEISAATVRNHVAHCLLKLGAHSRLEAVAVARRLHLV